MFTWLWDKKNEQKKASVSMFYFTLLYFDFMMDNKILAHN